MEQTLLTVPVSQYHPLMVSMRVCATTTDSQIAAFGNSQVAVYNDGVNVYPITSLPAFNLTMQPGFPGSLSWSIVDNRYLVLTAVNDAPINWVIGYNIDR